MEHSAKVAAEFSDRNITGTIIQHCLDYDGDKHFHHEVMFSFGKGRQMVTLEIWELEPFSEVLREIGDWYERWSQEDDVAVSPA